MNMAIWPSLLQKLEFEIVGSDAPPYINPNPDPSPNSNPNISHVYPAWDELFLPVQTAGPGPDPNPKPRNVTTSWHGCDKRSRLPWAVPFPLLLTTQFCLLSRCLPHADLATSS